MIIIHQEASKASLTVKLLYFSFQFLPHISLTASQIISWVLICIFCADLSVSTLRLCTYLLPDEYSDDVVAYEVSSFANLFTELFKNSHFYECPTLGAQLAFKERHAKGRATKVSWEKKRKIRKKGVKKSTKIGQLEKNEERSRF